MKLYELTGALATLLEYYADSESSYSEECLKQIHEIEVERDYKLEACCAVYKNMQAERDIVANEIKRLRAKQEVLENKLDDFKRYIENNLYPGEKWTNGVHKLSWRASDSVGFSDETLLPQDYWRVKKEPDKALILRKLKNGEEVQGAFLVHKNNLQIG